jgi:hypothetical protein
LGCNSEHFLRSLQSDELAAGQYLKANPFLRVQSNDRLKPRIDARSLQQRRKLNLGNGVGGGTRFNSRDGVGSVFAVNCKHYIAKVQNVTISQSLNRLYFSSVQPRAVRAVTVSYQQLFTGDHQL